MKIHIRQEHTESIKIHGEENYPDECCGFLLGKECKGVKEVGTVVSAANTMDDGERYHRYLISPEDFLAQERRARKQGQNVVGFYHSHPDAEARPSKFDREQAWPWYSYVIVSVEDHRAKELASWILQEDRAAFAREELIIVS